MIGGKDWQAGRSLEADFEKNTWTFEMEGNYHVEAGDFALCRYDAFHKAGVRMDRAEGILRDILNENGVSDRIMQRISSFFDPEPL